MTDRDAIAAAFAARDGATGSGVDLPRGDAADALTGVRDGLNSASVDAVREAWWRRGGELFEPVLRAARRAPHPSPIEAPQVRRSLIETGRAGIASWTFERADCAASLVAVDRADMQIPVDHPMAEDVALHLADVRQGWQQLHLLEDGSATDAELAHLWSTRWRLPDQDELTSALRMLEHPAPAPQVGLAPGRSMVLARLTAALASVDPEWRVAERTTGAAIASASPEHKVVYVDPARVVSEQALERLIVHEVFGHAARSSRASSRADMFSAVALGADASETEEGMAMLVEGECGVSVPAVERRYAARLIAVDLASRAGIDDVFAQLLQWLTAAEAAAIAVRVKRGVRDPSQSGAYPKDVIYWRGAVTLARHLAEHPDDLPVLRETKWGLNAVRRFGGLFVSTGVRS